ncbi:CHAP domain-containing protein [Candidatus Dojkabacteria bacterium]|jgi:hypothetical protein|nr:CHAP domain-containing protein [Candidatus Dojkabacteria bacterium]
MAIQKYDQTKGTFTQGGATRQYDFVNKKLRTGANLDKASATISYGQQGDYSNLLQQNQATKGYEAFKAPTYEELANAWAGGKQTFAKYSAMGYEPMVAGRNYVNTTTGMARSYGDTSANQAMYKEQIANTPKVQLTPTPQALAEQQAQGQVVNQQLINPGQVSSYTPTKAEVTKAAGTLEEYAVNKGLDPEEITPAIKAEYENKFKIASVPGKVTKYNPVTGKPSQVSQADIDAGMYNGWSNTPLTNLPSPADEEITTSDLNKDNTISQKATLVNPATGERVAVEVGSNQAQQFFGQGYVLEGQSPSTGQATFVNPTTGQRVAADQGSSQAKLLMADGYVPEVNLGVPTSGSQIGGTSGTGVTGATGQTGVESGTDGQISPNSGILSTGGLNDRINAYMATFGAAEDATAEQAGLSSKNLLVNKIGAELDKMKADIDFESILSLAGGGERADILEAGMKEVKDEDITKAIEGGLLSNLVTEYNATESRIDRAEALQRATNLYNYNLKTVDYNLALGNAQEAQRQVERTADQMKEYRAMALEDMATQYNMQRDEIEDARYANEQMWEKEAAGYVPISQENYQAMALKYGEDKIFTDYSGQSYLRPDEPMGELAMYEAKKMIDAAYEQGGMAELEMYEAKKAIDMAYEANKSSQFSGFASQADYNAAKQKNDNILTGIDELLNSAGRQYATGKSSLLPVVPGTEAANFVAAFDTFKSKTILENIGLLKGVLSDADMKILERAGTKLSRNLTEEEFVNELNKLKFTAIKAKNKIDAGNEYNFNSLRDYLMSMGASNGTPLVSKYDKNFQTIVTAIENEGMDEEEALQFMQSFGTSSFNNDLSKSENSSPIAKLVYTKSGEEGGQCGRFVNDITGLGLGDSLKSKLAKMDTNIKQPEPGMVFVMPYKDTGHTGFIVGVNDDGTVTVKDSNWKLDEKVRVHTIPANKIIGLRRV